ncbi:MAG TPA: glycosyltransferase [Candidatus Dormibacteraeota bacterium]|nr:glycosyltransferase [Candidatus Dormibacteraeota bacterium]
MIGAIALGIVGLTSILLFAFGLNLLYLTWRATRLRAGVDRPLKDGGEPLVCVQVPVYDERYVAERVLDAVCELDWPPDRLEIQVLDDSDDETTAIIERRAAMWRVKGMQVTHVRRETREGYKAGALAYGLTLTGAPLIAIFDADFVPPRDFLRRTVGAFDDPGVGFAQARWGHLDEGYSWFTRLQALAIDFHFLVEQAVRSADGYFTNFTGTAGIWRRAAIEDSGGWSADTLTEDLDLSYRSQLRGWHAVYLENLVVPEELPVSIDAYRRQQSRWATGSFQSAFKLLIPVLRSRNRAAVKLQATVHLLAYGIGPLMLVQLICYPVLLLTLGRHGLPWPLADAAFLVVPIAVSPWFGFIVAQTRLGRRWWSGLPSLVCQVVGAGMSLTALIGLFRATRRGGKFVRTPKHRIEKPGQEWRHQAYVRAGDPRALGEAFFGIGALAIIPVAGLQHQWLLVLYTSMFALGFLTLASLTAIDALEVLAIRNLGRRALARLRAARLALVLLGLCALLLLFAAQMPEPFEDGYGHWLIAANLASTGHLHDPLFGMEDTWLPAYHVIAAAVLRVFGLWQLGALKGLGALLGLVTLSCVYALAPNTRQARLAVALLALNPVFLFTSGSAVVEPLLTAVLTGAALAAVRGRMKVAALLAALACLTATKAWIWIAAVAGFAAVDLVRRRARAGRRWPALAWAVPAIAVLVFLQLGFAPATHSVARGSLEVASATTRGSIPGGALARVAELALTYGRAALPLFAFGAAGLLMIVRRRSSETDRATLRFLHFPALVYLAAVFGLVAIGAYTGSHRYLYPALPSLALLAAAALDRHVPAVRLIAVAATGLVAVAFLPAFASFAADNTGLIAAGRAAAGGSGLLITDSPVVAFYSGRLPSEIAGSQQLPADRASAIEWMRSRDATELVVEDVSYYRATTVFPELASGRPTPPFESLGQQSQYQVTGGKTVYAYRVGAALSLQSIYPGVDATLAHPQGQGKTATLAKGLTLTAGGLGIAGEGMGFGAPIVLYGHGWVYSRTASTEDLSTATNAVWKRTFQLDEIGGDKAHDYAFVPIASRGEIEVTYTVDGTGVSVVVKPLWLSPGFMQVGILNEQSASFDDFADGTRTLIGARLPSWIAVQGSWGRLRSASLGVEWSVPSIAGAELHAGRELTPPDFNWAGLDYLFPSSFSGTSYHINVQEAR